MRARGETGDCVNFSRAGASVALAMAMPLVASCSKTYTEIEVRDPGRVGVGIRSDRGFEQALPPDGSQRVVPLVSVPGAAFLRRGREVAFGWGDRAVTLIDERGVFPRVPPGSGIEVRGQTLWAAYNVTPTRVLPQNHPSDDSVPVMLATETANVVDAREVKEVRHWPAYVCLPAGALLTVLGAALLSSERTSDKVGGGVYLAGAVPLFIYGVFNLTSGNEYKPLVIPGAPPP
jgi:hypothetical protein